MRALRLRETSPYFPRRKFCHACSELCFAIVFYLPIAILSLLAGAPFVPFISFVRWRARRRKPHRQPSSVNVAIIGGGWSGLQLAARLQELGVAWQGFEAASDFGGTWHPQHRYASLALHTCAWLASFAGFPYSNDPQTRTTRPTGAEMHAYLCRFAEHYRLRRGFHFNSRVTRIAASSKSRTATLAVARAGGGEVQHGPYDLIIFASIASEPHVPHLSNSSGYYAAGGRQLHASECSAAVLSQLVDARAHVAVVGGSKSAADIVLALLDRGVSSERLTWVYRRPYLFFKFERFFHGAKTVESHTPLLFPLSFPPLSSSALTSSCLTSFSHLSSLLAGPRHAARASGLFRLLLGVGGAAPLAAPVRRARLPLDASESEPPPSRRLAVLRRGALLRRVHPQR